MFFEKYVRTTLHGTMNQAWKLIDGRVPPIHVLFIDHSPIPEPRLWTNADRRADMRKFSQSFPFLHQRPWQRLQWQFHEQWLYPTSPSCLRWYGPEQHQERNLRRDILGQRANGEWLDLRWERAGLSSTCYGQQSCFDEHETVATRGCFTGWGRF